MKNKPKIFNRVLFWDDLDAFIEEHGIKVPAFAALVSCNYRQCQRWKKREALPSQITLKKICNKLNWDYERFFSVQVLLDQVLHKAPETFESLSAEYIRLRRTNSPSAVRCEFAGIFLAFEFLTTIGLDALLAVDSQFKSQIVLTDPAKRQTMLKVYGNPIRGLVLQVADLEGPLSGVLDLTEASLKMCRVIFLNESEKTSGAVIA